MSIDVPALFAALEEDGELLTARCPESGLPLWILVRFEYLRGLLDRTLWNMSAKDRFTHSTASLSVRSWLKTAVLTAAHCASGWRHPGGDLHVVASSVRFQDVRSGENNADLMHMLETMSEHSFAWEHITAQTTRDLPRLALRPSFGLRPPPKHRPLSPGIDAQLQTLCSLLRSRLDRVRFPIESRPDDAAVQTAARRQLRIVLNELDFWRGVFRRHRPKLILAEDGVYVGQKGLMLAASEVGIRTAEMQHGVLSLGHVAYNCPASWREDPVLRASWPDVLLTFGPWWREQTTLPWQDRRIIGRRLPRSCGGAKRPRMDVLIVGDAVDVESYLAFAAELAPLVAPLGLNVVFRPHPATRRLARDRGGVSVALSDGPLETALDCAQLVVGTYSTVLFEAIGRVPAIVMWDTAARRIFFPEPPFTLVSSPQEVATLLATDLVEVTKPRPEKFWCAATRQSQLAVLTDLMEA